MPPKSRKRKAPANNDNDNDGLTPPDRNTWPGWVEMESEPAFFNVMLKDMGVHGVKINEVWSLDDTELAILPQPVHALIFLFRYRETDKDDLEVECPDHVWYAEQVPDFACATVALLNIVNNIPGLEMGKDLRAFKDFTQDLTPRLRGDAIDDFTFVKRIHNSFARESDLLQADMHMKDKAEKACKRQATAKARKTKAEKAARANKKSSSPPVVATPAGTRTSGRARKSTAKVESETSPKATPQSPRPSTRKSSPSVSVELDDSESQHLNGEKTPSKKSNSPSETPGKLEKKKSSAKSEALVDAVAEKSKTESSTKSNSPANDHTKPEKVETPKKSESPDNAPSKTNGVPKDPNDDLSSPINTTSSPEVKANTSKKLKLNAPKTKPKIDPNADFTATIEKTESDTKPRRSGRQPKPRKDLQPATESNGSAAEDEEGFHFCAYMPIGDRVWKLDGMDRFPQDMGPIEPGSDWLSIAQPALQGRMAQYAAGAIEFNLMAVVHDPMVACVEALAANVKALKAVEAKLATVAEDWRDMLDTKEKAADVAKVVDHAFGMTNVDVERAELTPKETKSIADAEDLMQLLDLRKEFVLQQSGLRAACRDEMESVQSDAKKASARRHDYTEFAREWVGALAEQEVLGALLEA